ncbi:MAG: aminotransferase class V-fold PLP-dependent enzyme [Gemmatimonadota bacterium]
MTDRRPTPVAAVREREYRADPRFVFFNAASWGLVPRSSAEESGDLTLRRNRPDGFTLGELGDVQRRCRTAVARLLDVQSEEIALVPNTSHGVNLAAAMVGRGEPGTILVSHGEFPANVFPWKALEPRGFRVELVPTDELGRPREEEILARLGRDDVRALALSAVQYATGYRADLEALGTACRERDIFYCIDAIQAVGAVPFRPREVHADLVACGAQKWLCAPWGSGFAWIPRERQGSFDPPMVSWFSMKGATNFEDLLHYRMEWAEDARKFELATLGLQDYLGLARSAEIFLEMGIEAVFRHILEVHEPLERWISGRPEVVAVTPMEPAHRGGIVSFRVPDPKGTAAALEEGGVIFAVREGAVRLAPHFYNTVEEMERVVAILDRVM